MAQMHPDPSHSLSVLGDMALVPRVGFRCSRSLRQPLPGHRHTLLAPPHPRLSGRHGRGEVQERGPEGGADPSPVPTDAGRSLSHGEG